MTQILTLDNRTTQEKVIPKRDMGIVIQLPMEGGYGDLIAGYQIGQRLGEEGYRIFFSFENHKNPLAIA
jgi:ABC-type phosphonate transport system ATPase subunit